MSVPTIAPLFAVLSFGQLYSLGIRVSRPGAQRGDGGGWEGTSEWVGAGPGRGVDRGGMGTWSAYMGEGVGAGEHRRTEEWFALITWLLRRGMFLRKI